jgi:hypothetical protein
MRAPHANASTSHATSTKAEQPRTEQSEKKELTMAVNEEVDLQLPEDTAMASIALARTGSGTVERAEVWRNRRRSSRKRAVQACSIDVRRITRGEMELGRLLYPDVDADRPVTRADCVAGERPCLFVSCKHHLYLDVSPRTGAIKLNFPDLEVSEMSETCVLDIADRGGTPIEELGTIMNLTRERVRQVEIRALASLAALRDNEGLRGFEDEGPVRKRRLPVMVEDEDDEDNEVAPASEPDVFEPERVFGSTG